MRRATCALLLLVALWGPGCGLPAHVRPVPKGQLAVEAAIGGPAARLGGVPVPLVLSTVGARYGLAEKLDVSLHAHVTTMAVMRVFAADVGAGWLLFDEDGARPALGVSVRGYLWTDFKSAWSAFDAAATASWTFRGWLRPYLSFPVYVDALAGTAHLAPALGLELRLGRFVLGPELRWYAPETRAWGSPADWLSPGGQGAIGLVLFVRRGFLSEAAW